MPAKTVALDFTPAPEMADTIRQLLTAERDHRNAVEAAQRRCVQTLGCGQSRRAVELAGSLGCEPGFVLGLLP